MDQKPFSDVVLHGIVRDSQGRKMSKSLGNGIDPLEVIDKYGADSLRFSLLNGSAPGNDSRFYWEKVESYRNFANKIWNAARFVLMNMESAAEQGIAPLPIDEVALDITDKWILGRLNEATAEITAHLEEYELGLAAGKIDDLIWS